MLLCVALTPISSSTAQPIAPPETTIPNFDCYRDAASITSKMQFLAETYADISEIETIGNSNDGKPIYALKIGNEAILDKPHFVLLAGLHGNDFSQPEVALQLAERLLQGYDTNADLQWIVDNIELDLILLANPDGRQVAEGQAEVPFAEPTDVLSTKNGNDVDLESNFCVAHPLGQGCAPTAYEPETQAIQTYLYEKLGVPNPAQTPNELSRDLFVYFSSHNNKLDAGPLAIGNIRMPWFYKPNPSELSESTEPSLSWQNELAKMLKVLDPDLKGSIEPKINGAIFSDYPVDYVFRSYGTASLELSAYPIINNSPMDCTRFEENHPEYYLKVLLNMAKSAAQPYKIGYGPIVDELTKTGSTETELNYHAVIFEKNQIPDQPVRNPITSIHYYIDQPNGTETGELHSWEQIDTNPYTSAIDFDIPVGSLTPGKHILTLQACSQDQFDNLQEVCGLPLSAYLVVPYPENPDDPDPTEPPDDPDPPGPGSNTIYLPLIGR